MIAGADEVTIVRRSLLFAMGRTDATVHVENDQQLISRNPADVVETPRVIRKDITTLDAEQTATLLDAVKIT